MNSVVTCHLSQKTQQLIRRLVQQNGLLTEKINAYNDNSEMVSRYKITNTWAFECWNTRRYYVLIPGKTFFVHRTNLTIKKNVCGHMQLCQKHFTWWLIFSAAHPSLRKVAEWTDEITSHWIRSMSMYALIIASCGHHMLICSIHLSCACVISMYVIFSCMRLTRLTDARQMEYSRWTTSERIQHLWAEYNLWQK